MDKLQKLRTIMQECEMDAYIQPYRNKFQSHFLQDHDQRIRYLSGFESSAGYMIVTKDRAVVFYDQRYAIAIKKQVDPALFETVDYHETMPLEWIGKNLPDESVIGIDAWLHSISYVDDLQDRYDCVMMEENPVDMIWDDRPITNGKPAFIHAENFTGKPSQQKRQECAQDMPVFISTMDSIGWLLNIRGDDVPFMPALESYAILHPDACVDLFCMPEKITDDVAAHLGADVHIHPFEAMQGIIEKLDQITTDETTAPSIIARWNENIHHQPDPCVMAKAVKNSTEQKNLKQAHLRDGLALTRFLIWADNIPMDGSITELDISAKLTSFRATDPSYMGPSFENIVGFAENSASIHAILNEETNQKIDRPGMLLIDSGGQYHDGTTDVTRTICIGESTAEMKKAFTLTLKGHIAVSTAVFPHHAIGTHLDALARQYLWAENMDYGHGTGHGVGYFGDVHEGPCGIAPKVNQRLQPGMLLSIEPGYYKEGAFGLRIENLALVQETKKEGWLCFEPVTCAPIDVTLIDNNLLTTDEKNWLNCYHEWVYNSLQPLLNLEEQGILKNLTQKIM